MSRSPRVVAGGVAVLFLALHLPVLPRSLEDLDSINFALGVRAFDVARHQPHPPGYPLFIFAAKGVRMLVRSEVVALSVLGVVAGALATLALFALFGRLDRSQAEHRRALLAAVLTVSAPLYWFTAARPLSDMTGLAAALAIQAMALSATSSGRLAGAALLAGLSTGIRSQVAWLTVPTIVLAIWQRPRASVGVAARALGAFAIGALVWAIPLVWLTGGPAAYWNVLFRQGAEDLTGVTMLWTSPTVRQLARALYFVLVAPWGSLVLAVPVLVAAAVGAARLGIRARATMTTLAVAFGPYIVFDILFQETVTTRYALPVLVPMAYLAVCGLELLPRRAAAGATIVLAVACAGLSEQALVGYSRLDAPAFRMLEDMSAHAASKPSSLPVVLAMHRREDFDLRRPVLWMNDRLPSFERLATPPKHEWLEIVNYWNRGRRDPIWLVADPLRSDLSLFAHVEPKGQYRWSFDQLELIGGIRPSETDWYIVEPPRWYLGEGWGITPEAAGVAREDGRGPGHAPITGWIRRESGPVTLMIGGRNLSRGGPEASLRVAIDDQTVDQLKSPPGFFLRMLELPAGSLSGPGDYATITIALESAASEVAIEQFDAQQAGQIVFGFGDGWHEREYNPTTGKLWRWTSERATLRIRSSRRPLTLTLAGETETFRQPSHVVVRVDGQMLDQRTVDSKFTLSVAIPASALDSGEADVTIETDQTYVPAERSSRLRDQRRLGLKIYDCRITSPS